MPNHIQEHDHITRKANISFLFLQGTFFRLERAQLTTLYLVEAINIVEENTYIREIQTKT